MLRVLLTLVVLLVGGGAPQKPNTDARRHDVYIAGFFPYGKGVENSDTGRGVMPSVKLALDHVNEHSSILRNYRLHMWWNDTMCNAAVGVKAFFDMMHSGPHKLMLFGAACTHVTDPIAKASKHWHLTQLSYADTHPMFTKENFPNFFRIVPSENAFNSPRLSLLREFNWTRVGTIYQNEPRYSLAHNRLVAELDSLSYQVVETQSFTNEVTSALAKLKEKDTRVILGNFDEHWARVMFCEAYKMEMYGRRYQWIIMGTYSNEWWLKVSADSNCTAEEMSLALEQTILTDLLPLSTSGEITISGITADEYHVEYNSRRGSEYSRFHGYTYDGIWAVALAIQNVAHKIRQFRRNLTVIDFKYRDPLWERLFLDALHNTSFEGVTGPVRFYDNERKASILLKQFQEGKEIKVGEYSAATQHLDLTLGAPMRWIGKHPPKDRTLLIIEHTRVNKTAYAIFASLACCGIVMASVFLAFNIKYRNQRYIKMSSPHLNNLIIIGCMLTYTSIVFLGLDSGLSSVDAFPYICTARAWTLMAGFSLAFGAMFSKTWRVHSIFTDVKLNKKVIKDYQLFMVVGVLLAIDLVIMTTWQISDPFYRETKQLEPYPHPSSEDIVIIPENEYCASDKMTIFVGCIYAYKGLLMIFGAFLAWETRHVSIPALNDSRHVGLSVYNVAIMCICGAAVALVLADHQDAMFLIIGVFVMFCTTATLWLVFVPKMVELKRNPAGSIDKRCRATLRPMGSKTRRDSSASEMESKMKEVKANNSRYRKTLLEREGELQALIRRLGNEARELLDCATGASALTGCTGGGLVSSTTGTGSGDTNRLSVPMLRKDAPSATETSEITSLCSISSQEQFHSLPRGETQSRRRRTDSKVDLNGGTQSLSRASSGGLTQNGHRKESIPVEEKPEEKPQVIRKTPELHKAQTFDAEQGSMTCHRELRRMSTKGESMPRRCSLKSTPQTPKDDRDRDRDKEHISDSERVSCPRRVSVPVNRGTPKRKPDHGTHVVAKSELWDTGNQHTHTHSLCRCSSKAHQRSSRVSISTDEEDAPQHHRSVSERTRHTAGTAPLKRGGATGPVGGVICTTIERSPKKDAKLAHFQSTPNVNSATLRPKSSAKRHTRDIYNATSESELLDREILPIFQKLLTERNKSQHNIDYSFGRSCPNISIKCDIVEYL